MQHDTIALVDVSYIFAVRYHSKHRDPVTDSLNCIAQIADRYPKMILCFDAPPYDRATLFPDYKGQRAEPDEEEVRMKRELFAQLRKDERACAFVKGAEADDVIATLCADIQEADDKTCVAIFARDKDLFPLTNSRVTIHEPAVGDRPETLVTPETVKERTGVAPGQVVDWLALVGDTSDNFPGCPGIGAKKAAALLQKFGCLDAVYAKLDGGNREVAGIVGDALAGSLFEHRAQVMTARTLATLVDNLDLDLAALLHAAERGDWTGPEDEEPEDEDDSLPVADVSGMSLAQRLLAIQREVGPLQKSRKVEGKVRYKYASIGDHLNAAYPLLQRYGLLFGTNAVDIKVEVGVMLVIYEVFLYCADNPIETRSQRIIGGSRPCDVGPGICQSYAVKRWLAELLGFRDGWERDTDVFGGAR